MGSKPTYEVLQNRVAELEERLARYKDLVAREIELQKSKKWYQTLFEQANDAIFIESESDAIVDVNAKACELLGYTRDELLKLTVTDILAPEVHGRKGRIIQDELERHGGRTFESVDLHKDGTRIPVEVSTNRIGEDDLVLSIVRDIRARKAARKALSDAYRIIEKSPATAFIWENREGWPVRFVTRNVVSIFGYSSEAFQSGSVSYAQVIHPDDLDRVADEVAHHSVTLGRDEFTHKPYRIITKDGETRWVEDKTTVRRGGDGGIVGYQGIVEDITARKRTEDALSAEKERLAVTLHSIGDAVITTDQFSQITLMNPLAEKLTGWPQQEAIGLPLTEVFDIVNEATRKPSPDPARQVIEKGKIVGLANNTILTSRDGTEHVIADSCAPIRDSGGRIIGVVLVFRDVTETRMLEREVLKVEKLESLGVLAGGIAHDFNNFLTGIIGNISLAKLDARPGVGVYPILDEMQRAAARAKDLTQQLLTFSKGGEPVKQATDLAELIKEAAVFALRGSNVRCDFSFEPDLFLSEVDQGQLTQVIHNLILNADQAMPSGGVISVNGENTTLAPENALALDGGDYVKISIQDGGTGIKREYLKKIFDPYFTTKQKGSGLGLAVAFSVIDKHNGRISVESDVAVGTTFTIYLPAAYEMETRRQAVAATLADGSGRRLLVMDDEDFIRKLARQMLEKMGYAVDVAKDGEETVAKYRQALKVGDPFDAVILDLTIPGGMGGKETVKALLKLDQNVRAIVSSGYSNDPVMADFGRFGFRQAIRKPYHIEDMSVALKAVLEI